MGEKQTHYRTCNICEAMCGIAIEYQDKQIISIKGDKKDPFSKGHMCPKALALQDYYEDKDRIRTPLKKTSSGWQEISWQQAFDEITEKVTSIQSLFGKNALGIYLGNPNAHNFGNALFIKPFFKAAGTLNRYSSASTDQMPHHVAANYMLGSGNLIPIPDINRTQFMLIIGGNPAISNGSMMTAPGVIQRIKNIQKRGGKVVVIDPKRSKTAKMADQHIFVQPETDALLLAAMINHIFTADQVNLRHLANHVEGLSELESAIAPFTSQAVAETIGTTAETIKQLAQDFVNAESAVCYSRMGASTQSFGGLCQWLTNVLNIISGNFDHQGGAMFPLPAFNLLRAATPGHPNTYGKYQSRVKGLPFYNGEFPVATLTDEITTPGEGQIKAMITIAGNPVLSSPSGNKLAQAFKQLDFMVSIDIYLNETTKHADIILPPTSGVENSHFDVFFNSFAVSNTAKYSEALFKPTENQKSDWQILAELTARLTNTEIAPYTPEMILDNELKQGPYGAQGLDLAKLKANPHGIDLGPMKPGLPERLLTKEQKIALAPELFVKDLPRLQALIKQIPQSKQQLKMIGRRLAKSHNSWTQNSARLIKGKDSCTLEIHPSDAEARGLSQGQQVTVKALHGEVIMPVDITEDIMPGVVSIPQGWGHNQPDTQMTIAATQPGVSINDVTDFNRIDELTGNAALNGTPVLVSAA